MIKQRISSFFKIVLTFGIFAIVLLTFQSNPFSKIMPYHDSSMFMYFGKGIQQGFIPYVNMLDHKGPILFFINFIASIISPIFFHHGLFVIETCFLLVSFCYLYKISKIIVNNDYVFICSLFFICPLIITTFGYGNYSEEYAFTFIIITLYLVTKLFYLNEQLTKTNYFMIGFLGALTFFIRPNMIMLWVTLCVALVLVGLYSKEFKKLFEQAIYIFFGGISVTAIISIYAIFTKSFTEMINNSILLNFSYAGSSFDEKISAMTFFVKIISYNRFEFIIVFYLLYVIVNGHNFSKNVESYNLLVIILCLLNFFTVILSGRDYGHYLITELPYLFVLTVFSLNFIYEKVIKITAPSFLVLILIPIIAVPVYQTAKQAIQYVNVETTASNNFKNSYFVISKYIKRHSTAHDTIYVHAIDANIYLQSKRFSNSKLFVLPSLDYTKYKELSKYFEVKMDDNPPKYIVISKGVFDFDHQDNKRMNKFVYDTIKLRYHEIERFKDNDILLFKYNTLNMK